MDDMGSRHSRDELAGMSLVAISTPPRTEGHFQIHYNQGADLFTYLKDASIFAVKNGYIEALESMIVRSSLLDHAVDPEQVRVLELRLTKNWYEKLLQATRAINPGETRSSMALMVLSENGDSQYVRLG